MIHNQSNASLQMLDWSSSEELQACIIWMVKTEWWKYFASLTMCVVTFAANKAFLCWDLYTTLFYSSSPLCWFQVGRRSHVGDNLGQPSFRNWHRSTQRVFAVRYHNWVTSAVKSQRWLENVHGVRCSHAGLVWLSTEALAHELISDELVTDRKDGSSCWPCTSSQLCRCLFVR